MEKNALLNHEVVMASSDKTTNNFITKMKKEGRLVKIATKIYTTNLNDTPENIIRRNLFFILGELYPDAIVVPSSAAPLTTDTSTLPIIIRRKYRCQALPSICLKVRKPFPPIILSWEVCTCLAVPGPILKTYRQAIAAMAFPSVCHRTLSKRNWIKSCRPMVRTN